MNAINFLLKEHDKVRQIFAEIDKASYREETKKKKFTELCHELIRHEKMEQTVWYPYLKNNDKLDDTIKHLLSEEKKAAKAIKEFDSIKTDKEWEKKFSKLKEDVEHHASEEEHKLFLKVKNLIDENELEKIGKAMLEFKQQYENK